MKALFTSLLVTFFLALQLAGGEPFAVYGILQKNPMEALTICWIGEPSFKKEKLKYREADSENWFLIDSTSQPVIGEPSYHFHKVELEGLRPDIRYEFVLSEANRPYYFHTAPHELSRPYRFVVGGDIYHDGIEAFKAMNEIASKTDPDFAILGGDIAYAGAKFSFLKEQSKRWLQFLKIWSQTMIKSDGSLIPFVTTLGNHDINGRFDQTMREAPLYCQLFAQEKPLYRVLHVGDFLSLWLLDTGHATPIQGAQTAWLKDSLNEEPKSLFLFAAYHIPAFPSVRDFRNGRSLSIRRHWVPLFEKVPFTAIFEHHDHAYKRTKLIRQNQESSEGILYIGDGAWGVETARKAKHPSREWYLEKTASLQHIILVLLQGSKATFYAINNKGEIFDSFTR